MDKLLKGQSRHRSKASVLKDYQRLNVIILNVLCELNCEKVAPPLHQPIGGHTQKETAFCKVQQMYTKKYRNIKKYSELN